MEHGDRPRCQFTPVTGGESAWINFVFSVALPSLRGFLLKDNENSCRTARVTAVCPAGSQPREIGPRVGVEMGQIGLCEQIRKVKYRDLR